MKSMRGWTTIAFMPTIAAPTAAPVMAFSETGGSITRCSPKREIRSLHLLPTYHGLFTPCPIRNTDGSCAIAWWIASLIARLYVKSLLSEDMVREMMDKGMRTFMRRCMGMGYFRFDIRSKLFKFAFRRNVLFFHVCGESGHWIASAPFVYFLLRADIGMLTLNIIIRPHMASKAVGKRFQKNR